MVDLDGDGLELIWVRNSAAYFDFDNDGFLEKAGWVKPDDGLIAYDRNGNGTIDGITELFGNATTNAFTAFAEFDSNSDGHVNGSDAQFGALRVWRDLDGDGATDAGELKTLAESGIASISLAHTGSLMVIEGNPIMATGAFTRPDGTPGTAAAVLLSNDQMLSKWIAPQGFQLSEQAKKLPSLKGYGDLKDLDAAVTLDAGLAAAVEPVGWFEERETYHLSGTAWRSVPLAHNSPRALLQ